MASGQPMVSSLFAQDSVNPLSFFLKKVLWRWASGVGGRRKMMLGAASHGPAHRRQGRMVVFLHIEARVGSGSQLGDGAALSRDSTAPPHGGRI